jgi:thymidylate synthase ThyX
MDPKVTLISWTNDPIKTLCDVWWASKTEKPLDELPEPDLELFRRIIAQRIPVGEHLDFVFILENVSVSWREQAVRHRIGTHVGDRVGVDIVPDLAHSSWWSQSMRIQDMGSFADNRAYRVPETLKGKMVNAPNSLGAHGDGIDYAENLWREAMGAIQDAYNAFVDAGVPMEDARDLIPLGAQHRISWKLNLSALQHIIGKRSCWILQAGLWHPIIAGMIRELVTKVDPIFQDLSMPPCAKYADGDWCFNECAYHEENIRRCDGDDKLPVCPLYVENHAGEKYFTPDLPMKHEMHDRAKQYAEFWGRDPYTLGPLE